MADIPIPIDVGRVTHLHQMHRSEDDAGDPIDEGFLLGADGARGHIWYDPAGFGGGGGTSPFYDVTAYGATGDGSTDDTTAIEDTFDAADATNGGVIYFPPTADYYKITTLITRTGLSTYHLLGGGGRHGPARVHQATSNTGAFRFAPSSGTAERVLAPKLENLVISGAGGASSGKGVECTNDIHVEGCLFFGFYDLLYVGGASYYSYIARSTFTDADNAAIVLDGTNNTTIDTCRITGAFSFTSPISTVKDGIVIATPLNVGLTNRIINCSIEYFTGDGVRWNGGASGEFLGNYFETQQSSSGHAHLNIGESNATQSLLVAGNYFQGDGTGGFLAIKGTVTEKITVMNNRFGINSAIGIDASGGSNSDWILMNNKNSPAGTFLLPSSSYTLDPASPPVSPPSFATPAIVLGTAAAGGAASTVIRSDATIVAFDATVPVTQAFGDVAATGAATKAARRDHVHGMPAAPTGGGQILISDSPSTPLVFGDLLQNEAQNDLIYSD